MFGWKLYPEIIYLFVYFTDEEYPKNDIHSLAISMLGHGPKMKMIEIRKVELNPQHNKELPSQRASCNIHMQLFVWADSYS